VGADDLIEEIPLPDGRSLTVRHVRPEDADALAALYGSLSEEDRYRRFFSHVRVHRSLAERWIATATADGVGIVVLEHDPVERLVAEAGYARIGPDEGELAMTIAADRRGWLGPYLLDLLARLAAERGVANLEADVLLENRKMLGLLRHRGAVAAAAADFPVVRLRIGTGEGRPTWSAHTSRPRVLVEGSGLRWHGTAPLDRAGFEVLTCSGPVPGHHGGCPLEQGRPCPLAEGADAIVVAVPPAQDRRERLLAAHPDLHPRAALLVERSGEGGRTPDPPAPGSCPADDGSLAARLLAALPGLLSRADEPAATSDDGAAFESEPEPDQGDRSGSDAS
jgi:hypothetical protein